MKQLTLILVLFCCVIFVSCKKEYTCGCTVAVVVPSNSPINSAQSKTIKGKEEDAQAECDAFEVQLNNQMGEDGIAICDLTKEE